MEQEFVKNNLGVQEQIALIKEGNFYNQLYCGCEYSIRTKDDDIDKNLPK